MQDRCDKIINARIPESDYAGIVELIRTHRYINEAGVIRQAIKCLLGKENIAPCRYCQVMHILNIDDLCMTCAEERKERR